MVKPVNGWVASLGALGVLAYGLPGSAGELIDSAQSRRAIEPSRGSIAPNPTPFFPSSDGLVATGLPDSRLLPIEAAEAAEADPMALVTSVSQLTDVRPSDWAFTALQGLVERYGVIAGYPDGTFRGHRPLSRNEFAAGLVAVMSKIEERLLVNPEDSTVRADLITIRRLQAAYGMALTDVRQRMGDLENRTAQLEKQVFAPTTKLTGQSLQTFSDGNRASARLIVRTRLDLQTSFTGRDRLVTQLEMGNDENDAVAIAQTRNGQLNLLGTNGLIADGGGIDGVGISRNVRLRKLYYTFPAAPSLQVTVGTAIPPSDFIDRNRFANQSGKNFGSSFFSNNPLIIQNQVDRLGGAGAAIVWEVNPQITLRALHASTDGATPTPSPTVGNRGNELFGNLQQTSLELDYNPIKNLTVRLQYTHAQINGSSINAGGVNAEWSVNRQFGVFGRYGFGTYRGFNTDLGRDLSLDPTTWAAGFTVRNFLIPGSKAGFALGQPFVEKALNGATQTNFEGYFGVAINDNINFIPTFLVVSNPNDRRAATIWQWAIRMVFDF
jgi:Carbohydrate-selective porin, OprB family/S-layer homology domain